MNLHKTQEDTAAGPQAVKSIRFAKYTVVATASAAVDWVVFAVLVFSGVWPVYAQMTARIAGGLFSFVSNKFWSFKADHGRHLVVEGRRFLILYAVSYALSISSFYFLDEIVGLPTFGVKLATDFSIFFFNFVVMQAYVFHSRGGFMRLLARL